MSLLARVAVSDRRSAAVAALAAFVLAWLPAAQPVAGAVTSTRPAKQPPYYRGAPAPGTPTAGGSAGRLPVEVGLPAGLPADWLPLAALERLAEEMERWLAAEHPATPLRLEAGPKASAPVVYLGCALDQLTWECSDEERANVLAVTSGSKEWRRLVGAAARQSGVQRVLLVRLEVAPHWVRQRGFKGAKRAALGTGHEQELPWLSSLDTPVWVLQVTGALVDADGELVRSGAEGISALRTPFKASALGAQRLLTDEEVERVRSELRRADLPGSPLGWEAALRELARQLLGEPVLAAARSE